MLAITFDPLGLLNYTYDNDDNITGITDAVTAANSMAYGYDVRGRLARVDTRTGLSAARTSGERRAFQSSG